MAFTKEIVDKGDYQIYRTTQSGSIWQFRTFNSTTQKYVRKTTKQRDKERALRVATMLWKEVIATQDVASVNNKRKRVRKNKTGGRQEEQQLFDGDVKVFRVPASGKVWQVYIWIREEQKDIRRSLKTRDIELARDRAKEIYFDYRTKSRNNEPIFDKKAHEIVEAYLDAQEKRVKQGSITKEFKQTLKSRMKHYIDFIGADTNVTSIPEIKFEDYRLFRKESAPKVTLMTLYNERGTIKALYKFAVDRGLIRKAYVPNFGEWEKLKQSGEKLNRDALEVKEWSVIYKFMNNWHIPKYAKSNEQAHNRRMIREFCLILTNSGIRFGEARQLQWKDIDLYVEDNKKRAKINLPAHITKTRQARLAISRAGAPFIRIKKMSKSTKYNDLVFTDINGDKLHKKVYYKEWKYMLENSDLKESNKNIVYYCLRHTYATFQLYKGVDIYQLSKVMGTGVQFIQDHYAHVDIDRIKSIFTKDLEYDESGQIIIG
jgi:integrase